MPDIRTQLRHSYAKLIWLIPGWSSLRSIGRSRVVSFTIITPFVGWLILLNSEFVRFVTLTSALFKKAEQNGVAATVFTESSLLFTYMGLVCIGLGSLLYTIACPVTIKSHDSERDYVASESDRVTQIYLNYISGVVATRYCAAMAYYDFSERRSYLRLWEMLLNSMYSGNVLNNDVLHDFVTPMDTLKIDEFTEQIASDRRGFRALVETFRGALTKRKLDMLTIFYLSEDVNLPSARLVTAVLYVFGFLLLVVPTARTFVLIIGRLGLP